MENKYTNIDKFNMLECYILCHKNRIEAINMYQAKYPERRSPHPTIFRKLVVSLKEYGSFLKPSRENARVIDDDKEIEVLAFFEAHPETSIRIAAEECGISINSVHRILKKHKYRPYKIKIVQELRDGDQQRRLLFCQWFQEQEIANPNFARTILWTDEANFSNRGIMNRKNNHFWSTTNPCAVIPGRPQHRFSLNVWVGVLGNRIIGPYFYNGTLTGERYLNFLRPMIEEFLDNLPVILRQSLYYQQDGAPAHNSRDVVNYLNETFGNRWIGTQGPVPWPPRSPDLTILDFYLWGYIKDIIYKNRPHDLYELRRQIEEVLADIDGRTLLKVVRCVSKRVVKCIEQDGRHFEQFM